MLILLHENASFFFDNAFSAWPIRPQYLRPPCRIVYVLKHFSLNDKTDSINSELSAAQMLRIKRQSFMPHLTDKWSLLCG